MTARIRSFDGLRGILATYVVASHTLVLGGSISVEGFFVLSGFLIGGLLLDNATRTDYLRVFLSRRIARTWPLYLLVGAVYICILPNPDTFLSYWLTFNIGSAYGMSLPIGRAGILWSIGVEEYAYLVMALLMVGLSRARYHHHQTIRILLLVGILSFAWRIFYVYEKELRLAYALPTTRFDAFTIGAFAAWCARHKPQWTQNWIAVSPIFLIIRIAYAVRGEDFAELLLWQQSIASVGFGGLLLALNAGEFQPLARVLEAKPLVKLGEVSYGIYVLHPLMLDLFRGQPSKIVYFASVLISTVVLALLTWRYVEEPLIRRVKAMTSTEESRLRLKNAL